jgi:hypothetical protein
MAQWCAPIQVCAPRIVANAVVIERKTRGICKVIGVEDELEMGYIFRYFRRPGQYLISID